MAPCLEAVVKCLCFTVAATEAEQHGEGLGLGAGPGLSSSKGSGLGDVIGRHLGVPVEEIEGGKVSAGEADDAGGPGFRAKGWVGSKP